MSHSKYVIAQKYSSNANIEITNKCGLYCAQCVRAFLKLPKDDKRHIGMKQKMRESGDISIDNLRKIFEFFENNISLCGQFSDPVYHKKFYDVLRLCAEFPDTTFRIHTASHQKNISWYRKAFELTPPNVIWIFGLDGLPDTSPIYRVGQNAELIYQAIVLGSEMGKRITWQFIVFGHNEHQIEEAKMLAEMHKLNLKIVKTDRSSSSIKPASDKFKPVVMFKDVQQIEKDRGLFVTKGIKESVDYNFNLPKV